MMIKTKGPVKLNLFRLERYVKIVLKEFEWSACTFWIISMTKHIIQEVQSLQKGLIITFSNSKEINLMN